MVSSAKAAPKAEAEARRKRAVKSPSAKPSPPSLSRAEQRERSRTLILDTAIRLFAERGYDGVRLDEIAEAAGVRRTLVLYYFPSKDELWRTSADTVALAFNKALHEKARLARESNPASPFSISLEASLDAFLEQPEFPKFLVREGGTKSPRLEWLIERFDYVEVDYGGPKIQRVLKNTVARDIFFSVFLSMTALGPLMEAWLSRVAERNSSGVYPMTAASRTQLLSLLAHLLDFIGQDDASES